MVTKSVKFGFCLHADLISNIFNASHVPAVKLSTLTWTQWLGSMVQMTRPELGISKRVGPGWHRGRVGWLKDGPWDNVGSCQMEKEDCWKTERDIVWAAESEELGTSCLLMPFSKNPRTLVLLPSSRQTEMKRKKDRYRRIAKSSLFPSPSAQRARANTNRYFLPSAFSAFTS